MSLLLALSAGAAAGLAASPHCVAMCAPLQALQLRRSAQRGSLWLHGGRVLGYSLAGLLAAGLGLGLLQQLPSARWGILLQASSALVLLGMGLRYWQPSRSSVCSACHHQPSPRQAGQLFSWGSLRVLLPCAPLYSMLFLAAVSRDPAYGALSLAAFGLATVPALGGGNFLLQRFGTRMPGSRLAGGLLIASGLFTVVLAFWHWHEPSGLWCLSP